jgi:exodeoxyribonuclease VII small subunit
VSPPKKEKSKHNFEQSLKRLEKIVEALEKGDIPLEDAISMYEEGIQLSKQCVEELSKAELRIQKLSKDVNGNIELLDFQE